MTSEEVACIDQSGNAELVFHGTCTGFCAQIEAEGWRLNSKPYSWEDTDFVLGLAERLGVYGDWWSGAGNSRKNAGASFTGKLRTAIQYATQCRGGENLGSLIEGTKKLLMRMADDCAFVTEAKRLSDLLNRWERLVADSLPVVYVVRGTPIMFPRMFRSYEAQMRIQGRVTTPIHEVVAETDVPPSAIEGRHVLPRPSDWN